VRLVLELAVRTTLRTRAERDTCDRIDLPRKTIDAKSILIVGSNSQFSGTERESVIKLQTFELFRRDSRNREILTYDAIYESAKFVVGRGDGRP